MKISKEITRTILETRGYRPFINHLKSVIPNDNRVRLNCEVTKVKFISDENQLLVEINDLKTNRKLMMKCAHMIWTNSLGFLKENLTKIFTEETDFIQQKEKTIKSTGWCHSIFIFTLICFVSFFSSIDQVLLIYDQRDFGQKMLLDSLCSIIKEKNSSNHRIKYEKICRKKKSIPTLSTRLFHYDVLPSTNVPLLICWFVGSTAIMIEKLSDQFAGQICHEVLCSGLNISSENFEPQCIIKWFSNSWSISFFNN